MERPRLTAAERERAAQEEAQRKTKLSLRLGGLGVAVLFLGGFGAWVLPADILVFLVVMGVGLLLILAALFLVWSSPMLLRLDDETKIY